jgi:hypothetical protein
LDLKLRVNNGFQPDSDQISINSQSKSLAPLISNSKNLNERNISTSGSESQDTPVNQVIKTLTTEMNEIQYNNQNLRNQKELSENRYYLMMNENNVLQIKLQNLGIINTNRKPIRRKPHLEITPKSRVR